MDKMDKKEKKFNKHVAAVHCSSNITLLQRKIYNGLLYHARAGLNKDDYHQIDLKTLSEYTAFNSNDIGNLKKSFKELAEIVVEWNILEDDRETGGKKVEKSWCASTLLASAEIDFKNKILIYEFSRKMSSLMHHPDVYARISLMMQNKFKSSYALALYENCLRFIGVGGTSWLAYQDFRSLMGVPESKYKLFKNFNSRVISIAVKEINENSDILIRCEIKKIGRKVVSLKFHVERKKDHVSKAKKIELACEDEDGVADISLIEVICKDFDANEAMAKKIIKGHDNSYVKQKINLVKSSDSYLNGSIKNKLAYLKSAINEDYKPSNKKKALNTSGKNKTAITGSIEDEYRKYKVEKIISAFNSTNKLKQDEIKSCFESEYEEMSKKNSSRKIIYDIYKAHGVSSVSEELCEHIEKNHKDLISDLLSIEEFLDIANGDKI